MRLECVRIRNYRVHRDRIVEFDPRMTLICGPNESGKSTLVEAIHRGLFLKARAGGETLEGMKSPWGDAPQVELACRFGDAACRIRKIFRGTRGDCTLELPGEKTQTGDEAETTLATLLVSGGPIEGRGAASALRSRWAHLWVWQGTSGSDPAGSAVEQHAALLRRLQSQGGSAVMQSDLDTRTLREIQRRLAETFVAAGNRYKTGSEVALAAEELNTARADCQTRQQALSHLQEAADNYLTALQTIEAKQRAVVEAEGLLRAAQAKLQQAEEIGRQMEPLARRVDELDREVTALNKIGADLSALRQRQQTIQAELAPMETQCRTLEADEAGCRDTLKRAEHAWDAARQALAGAVASGHALADHAAALERGHEAGRLERLLVDIQRKREERNKLMSDLAALPIVSDKDLSALRKADRERETARAQLDALGARIEVLETSVEVSVDGQGVEPGSTRIITDEADVRVGGHTRLRILPGQSSTLAEARQEFQTAETRCCERLALLAVATMEEAVAVAERRKQLDGRLDVLKAELAAMGDDSIEEQVLHARQAKGEADAKADRSSKQTGIKQPATREEARRLWDEASRVGQVAEREENRARSVFESARDGCAKAGQRVAAARSEASQLMDQIPTIATRIATLEEMHGDDGQRARDLLSRQAERSQTQQQVELLKTELIALQPDGLKSDMQRLRSVLDGAQQAIRSSEQNQAVARDRMRLHGTSDPHADLAVARARLERAELRFRELEMQAKAIQLLATLAEEVQQRMSQHFTQPLVETVQGYMECIFGAGASLGLEWKAEAGSFATLTVRRERQGLGNFPFESLSGGAREQVGVAMRLAMAEVLAADHGGCLPVVLDDAFTNSDPDRVRLLHRMLYRAAERGLQLIVLTSNPEHYNTLGAKEVHLTRPVLPGVMVSPPADSDPDPIPDAGHAESAGSDQQSVVVLVTDDQTAALLERLRQFGGSSGNQALRESLGWDEATYAAVREQLVQQGTIQPGRGRGGSVRLNET